ncbi:MAG: glycogen synthase [Myxococcaceae bacterium]
MNILFLSSEVAPFAKTGGLGDVSSALPAALHRRGHDVRVFMPLYSRIDRQKTKFRPVETLQNLRISVGPRTFEVSIYAAPLPAAPDMEVYFVHCPQLYGRASIYTHDPDEHFRFLLLGYTALTCAQRMRFPVDIVHCNDWQTGLVPLILETRFAWDKQVFSKAKTVLTIHNLNYQGMFPARIVSDTGLADSAHLFHQDQLREGRLNMLLHGILYSNGINTVSPSYSREIRTPEYGAGLDGLLRSRGNAVVGILNGVDYNEWNPEHDKHLPAHYTPDDLSGKAACKKFLLQKFKLPHVQGVPLFAIVSRLAGQKGFDLIPQALPPLLQRERFQLVVQGSGERRFERMFRQLEAQFPTQVRFHNVFDNALAHQMEAGADFFVMPSRYEPCGLNQLYSLKYGTVPVVRKTGGLADTVKLYNPRSGAGNGIVFDHYEANALRWGVKMALDAWHDKTAYQRMQQSGMAEDFSWDAQVTQYEQFYSRV